jgi:hypothetical protein
MMLLKFMSILLEQEFNTRCRAERHWPACLGFNTFHPMMRLWRVFACGISLAAVGVIAHAQARDFDIARFSPPGGWTAEEAADHVTYTRIDQQAGTFCMFAVYASQPAGADPAADFASEWQGLVAASFTAPPAPLPTRRTTSAGQAYLEASAIVSRDGQPYAADLSVLLAGDRVQSILAVATDAGVLRAYKAPLAAFLGSFTYGSRGPRRDQGEGDHRRLDGIHNSDRRLHARAPVGDLL